MLGNSPRHDLYPALKTGITTVILVDLYAQIPVTGKNDGFVVKSMFHAWELL